MTARKPRRSLQQSPLNSKPAVIDATSEIEGQTAAVDVAPRRIWWLYLLECRGGRLYAGITPDVAARFARHCSGKGARFTRANPPLRILGAEPHASRAAASAAEWQLKRLRRDQKLGWAKINPFNPAEPL